MPVRRRNIAVGSMTLLVLVAWATACGSSPPHESVTTAGGAAVSPESPAAIPDPALTSPSSVVAQLTTAGVGSSSLLAGIARSGSDWTLVLHDYRDDDDVLSGLRLRGTQVTPLGAHTALGDAQVVAVLDGDPPNVVLYLEADGRGGDLGLSVLGAPVPAHGPALGAPPWSHTDHVPWFSAPDRGYVAWVETESRPATAAELAACGRRSCSGVVGLHSRWVVGALAGAALTPVPFPWGAAGALNWIHGGLDASGALWMGFATQAGGVEGQAVQLAQVNGTALRLIGAPTSIGDAAFVGLLHVDEGPVMVSARLSTSPASAGASAAASAEVILTFFDDAGVERSTARETIAGNANGAIHGLACGGQSWVIVGSMAGARHEVHALSFASDGTLRSRTVLYSADEPDLAATATSRASREPVMSCADDRIAYAFVIPGTDPDAPAPREGRATVIEWSARP